MEIEKFSHGIKGILFDLDGTLISAKNWHKQAFNMTLANFGYTPLDEQDHLDNFNGLSTYRKLDILRERCRFNVDNDKFNAMKQVFTIELINKLCKPVAHVTDVVNYAKSAFGGRIAVVTNCSRVTVNLMLKRAKLFDKFKIIITNNDVDGKIKPHPFPYIKAQNLLGLENKPKACLAIDDNQKGITSAREAGCHFWHLRNFEDLTVKNLMAHLGALCITI